MTWLWRHFTPSELASPDIGNALMSPPFMDRLEALRVLWGRPIRVTSGYRTVAHNKAVGGKSNSMHVQGRAVDFYAETGDYQRLIYLAEVVGMRGIGLYPNRGFVHMDDRDGGRAFWMGV